MRKNAFPLLASGIGLVLALVLVRSTSATDSEPLLPPLTLLFISEFGFLLSAAGAWVGARAWLARRSLLGMLLAAIGCLALALAFLYIGLGLWNEVAPA